jgi:hypothetical protein
MMDKDPKIFTISTSYTQDWPQYMDSTQLEILISDLLFDEDDTRLAAKMLNLIGIKTD